MANYQLTTWLETHWVNPTYKGFVLGGLSLFFFIAATNTLAGWLYVLSGFGLALLAIAAYLPRQSLKALHIQRERIEPVSAGDYLTIDLTLSNPTIQGRVLLEIQDNVSAGLGQPAHTTIEYLPAEDKYHWIYYRATTRRGIYRWHTVELCTAAPLDFFQYRRLLEAKAKAIVYPTILPLSQCPLLDELGKERDPRYQSQQRAQMATEGITRTLRPYRWGDSTRLIHWRTSARYGELRVRELEIFQGGQEIFLCLDTQSLWQNNVSYAKSSRVVGDLGGAIEPFEQAVIVAASLYFYAGRNSIPIKLWTAATGLIQGNRTVLETLAATQPGELLHFPLPTQGSFLWLTQNPDSLATLPTNSRWVLWPGVRGDDRSPEDQVQPKGQGILINLESSLESQLQSPLQSVLQA